MPTSLLSDIRQARLFSDDAEHLLCSGRNHFIWCEIAILVALLFGVIVAIAIAKKRRCAKFQVLWDEPSLAVGCSSHCPLPVLSQKLTFIGFLHAARAYKRLCDIM